MYVHFLFILSFLVKPRSKSACGSRRSVASSVASNESHQRHATVHFQLPSPISSPQKQHESKRSTDPKIDNKSIDATTVNNNNNNNNYNNNTNTRLSTQEQRKMFFMQSNPIQNAFNQNKPPSGKRSYTIINTELHTNEMWVTSNWNLLLNKNKQTKQTKIKTSHDEMHLCIQILKKHTAPMVSKNIRAIVLKGTLQHFIVWTYAHSFALSLCVTLLFVLHWWFWILRYSFTSILSLHLVCFYVFFSVRPTPQAAATTIVSKFTLHTSSLPKPQYPVPVSLAPRYSMDVKNAKQAANNTKKGFQAQREISADSGIGSLSSGFDVKKSPKRQRPRNLEMVFSGRNKFHVRDLIDDSFSDDNIQPLALPQLPTVYSSKTQPANLRWVFLGTNWI